LSVTELFYPTNKQNQSGFILDGLVVFLLGLSETESHQQDNAASRNCHKCTA